MDAVLGVGNAEPNTHNQNLADHRGQVVGEMVTEDLRGQADGQVPVVVGPGHVADGEAVAAALREAGVDGAEGIKEIVKFNDNLLSADDAIRLALDPLKAARNAEITVHATKPAIESPGDGSKVKALDYDDPEGIIPSTGPQQRFEAKSAFASNKPIGSQHRQVLNPRILPRPDNMHGTKPARPGQLGKTGRDRGGSLSR